MHWRPLMQNHDGRYQFGQRMWHQWLALGLNEDTENVANDGGETKTPLLFDERGEILVLSAHTTDDNTVSPTDITFSFSGVLEVVSTTQADWPYDGPRPDWLVGERVYYIDTSFSPLCHFGMVLGVAACLIWATRLLSSILLGPAWGQAPDMVARALAPYVEQEGAGVPDIEPLIDAIEAEMEEGGANSFQVFSWGPVQVAATSTWMHARINM